MEFLYQSPSFSILLLVLLSFSMLLSLKFLTRKKSKKSPFPPGPQKLPIIGNLHQMLTRSPPHRRLHDLARLHGPIMHLQLGHVSTVIISSPGAAKEFFKNKEAIFANRAELACSAIISYNNKDLMFAPYGEYTKQVRKICLQELLGPRQVQSFRFIREEEVLDLVRSVAHDAGSVINLSEKAHMLAANITSRAAFSNKTEAAAATEFLSYVKGLMEIASGFNVADAFPDSKLAQWIGGVKNKAFKLLKISDNVLEKIIKNRKTMKITAADNEEDLLAALLKYQQGTGKKFSLTMENIKAIIMDIFIGGVDTAPSLIEWAMSELLKNPRLMERAHAEVRSVYNGIGRVEETMLHELKFLKLIIKETLRLYPPVPLLAPRESSEGCQLSGYEIPKKTRAIVNLWAIGRDPEYWKEAESFDPDRFQDYYVDFNGTNFHYIPFSAGRRNCPGMQFSIAMIELALANLLYHFDWSLPDGQLPEELDMIERTSFTAGRKHGLCVVPVPYTPAHSPNTLPGYA